MQIAGLSNTVRKESIGMQFAGISNTARHGHTGLQIAGIANTPMNQDSSILVQLAGITNFQNGDVKGFQVAGLTNRAKNMEGVQVSGLTNKAWKIKGAQIAPLYNQAYIVKGVQIGLINVSNQMNGIPIGLINIVRNNGYYDLEIFYSDDFQANAMFKMGAQKFHNIFAFSYETDSKHRWAYGYGIGSQWGRGNFRVNTDVVSYYVVEDEFPNGGFGPFQLNVLSKFRLLPALHLGDFGIFAGPVLNFMVSDYQNPDDHTIGSDIAPKSVLLEKTEGQTNYKIWIGYSVGLRI